MLKQIPNTRPFQKDGVRTLKLAREFRLHTADNRRVIENLFVALGTPVALSCYLLYKYEEYDQLVSKELHPSSYNDGESFRDDFAAVSLLRKHETLKTSFNRKESALSAFKQGELSCKDTNQRIRRYLLGCKESTPNEAFLHGTIRKIGSILGSFDIDTVLDLCSWGPGTTISVKGSDTSAARKFDIDCDFTADAYDLFGSVIVAAYPSWVQLSTPRILVGNRISTVPKNAKTDRTIAVEPGGNSWLQSGIGKSIRRRLRFSGYNLNSDLKNQRGAYKGSIDDSLATIDFKAASDTISIKTVELLLPPEWFKVLDAARSQYYTLNGITSKSEKFSTMGNGFTFELESLIFLSIALAVCQEMGFDDSDIAIFGDDLVLPSACVAELTTLCTFLGFTINATKSFSRGPFRESCGTYYFNGLDVKPLYINTDLRNAKDIYRLANATRNLSHSFALRSGCDVRFRGVWSLLTHLLPSCLRLFGPVSAGDAVIHQNIDESQPKVHPLGWCGFTHAGLIDVSVDIAKESSGLLLAKLSKQSRHLNPDGCDVGFRLRHLRDGTTLIGGNKVSLREKTRMVYKKNMFVYQWYNFGQWT